MRSLMLSILIGIVFPMSNTQAQNQQAIQNNMSVLQAEHQKELKKWTVKAYEGDPEAQFKVGVLYTNAQFSEPDFSQAVYWYKQAARQGHVLAQYNLGHQYLTGVGVKKSETTAMQWWLKSAAQDHALSQFNLGRAYYLGIGLNKDLDESRRWFELAARNHEPKSIEILEQLGWAEPGQYTKQQDLPQTIAASEPTSVVAEDRDYPVIPARSNDFQSVVQPLEDDAPQPTPTEPTPDKDVVEATAQVPNAQVDVASRPPSRILTEQQRETPSTVTRDTQTTPVRPAEVRPVEVRPAEVHAAQSEANVAQTPKTTAPKSESSTAQTGDKTAEPATSNTGNEIAAYTNPAIRSVLIGVIKQRDALEILQRGAEWTSVRSRNGFPVWVSGDFVRANGDTGTITGSSVNARSVPIIINGTVVGQLDKDESVRILGQRGDWYRIMSPARFIAWVKTSELHQRQTAKSNSDG